jgi:hypothetical protein
MKEIEFAMLKTPDGVHVERAVAQRSLAKGVLALQQAGGRVPCGPDGAPMLWNEHRGWHSRDTAAEPRRSGRPLSELIRHQLLIDHRIRQERLDREIQADRDLVRGASLLAWYWAQTFRHKFVPQPSFDAPAEVLIGWRLARRGYHHPPAWLLRERKSGQSRR